MKSKNLNNNLSTAKERDTEYFHFGNVWVNKKLMFAVAACLFFAIFVLFTFFMPPIPPLLESVTVQDNLESFRYDDVSLAAFTGKAKILDKGGKTIYIGDIVDGICSGSGVLYNKKGIKIYEGEFKDNRYDGTGKSFHENGVVKYIGSYSENMFSGRGLLYDEFGKLVYDGEFFNSLKEGTGKEFDSSGALLYSGDFSQNSYNGQGKKFDSASGQILYEGEFFNGELHGIGTLYNSEQRAIYTGRVVSGEIDYSSFIGSTLEEIEQSFLGSPEVFYTDDETAYFFKNVGVIFRTATKLVKMESQNDNDEDPKEIPYYEGDRVVDSDDPTDDNNDSDDEFTFDDEPLPDDPDDPDDDGGRNLDEFNIMIINDARYNGTRSGFRGLDFDIISVLDAADDENSESKPQTSEQYQPEEDKQVYLMGNIRDKSEILIDRIILLDVKNTHLSLRNSEFRILDDAPPRVDDCAAILNKRSANHSAYGNINFIEKSAYDLQTMFTSIDYAGKISRSSYEVGGVRYTFCSPLDNGNELSLQYLILQKS